MQMKIENGMRVQLPALGGKMECKKHKAEEGKGWDIGLLGLLDTVFIHLAI